MDQLSVGATGDFPECMEVLLEETPLTVPKIRWWDHRAPLAVTATGSSSDK